MIRAGNLNRVVDVQRFEQQPNDYNELIGTWRSLAVMRASIEPLTGREFITRTGELAEVTARIRMRRTSANCGLDTNDRIVSDGVVYDIVAVMDPWQNNREVELLCKRAGAREPGAQAPEVPHGNAAR